MNSITYKSKGAVLANYQYRFDDAGQVSEQTGTPAWFLPKPSSSAKYNELNQITEWNGDANAFLYDKDGNLIKGILDDGVPFEAEYDAENRLTRLSFTRDNTHYREEFVYAHNNMLAQYQLYKNKMLVEDKQFVRLGLVELQQRNAQGQVVQEYAWDKSAPGGVGGLLVTKTGSNVYTYAYNHLGHVQKVLNASGQEVESYQYTPYGQVEGGDFNQQPFGYSTKRSDFKSGLVYFGYRFYSPYQRRWLTRDPLQEQGGINLYAYVNGDPLGYIDPDGRWSAGFSFYDGVGWGMSFGFNPNTGKAFGKIHAGVGVGGGFSFDPNDNGDEARQKCSNGLDLSLGTEANWGVNVGPYGLGASSSTDFFSGKHGNLNNLGNLQPNLNAAGVDVSAGGDAHVSFTGSFIY
ncbi:RHS repeat domain-containing protein [Vibrio sp. Vb339]|uniref:RHS repeat domain-containing protein n=1 Tax=Vibrio sp. Vb339 TaxID=1192013 RepID=UPI0020A6290B|nr:RHS repeat-associated core domain-containing protein [Vibrio sp. Vb339]